MPTPEVTVRWLVHMTSVHWSLPMVVEAVQDQDSWQKFSFANDTWCSWCTIRTLRLWDCFCASSHLLDLGLVDEGPVEAEDLLVLQEPQRRRLRRSHRARKPFTSKFFLAKSEIFYHHNKLTECNAKQKPNEAGREYIKSMLYNSLVLF